MDQRLQTLIANYHPNQKAIETLQHQKLVIFAGTAGAGKNTIMNELLKSGKYHDIVTSTTRQPRENNGVMERDGIDYHFLTTEQAVEKLMAGDYIEVAPVHEKINGVLISEIEVAQRSGKIPIVDVDVQGVHTLKSLSDKAIAIFVAPPSFDEWMKRIKSRYDTEADFETAWGIRCHSALTELEDALSRPYYHFLINDDLAAAVSSAEKIIENGNELSENDAASRADVEKILSQLKASLQTNNITSR